MVSSCRVLLALNQKMSECESFEELKELLITKKLVEQDMIKSGYNAPPGCGCNAPPYNTTNNKGTLQEQYDELLLKYNELRESTRVTQWPSESTNPACPTLGIAQN